MSDPVEVATPSPEKPMDAVDAAGDGAVAADASETPAATTAVEPEIHNQAGEENEEDVEGGAELEYGEVVNCDNPPIIQASYTDEHRAQLQSDINSPYFGKYRDFTHPDLHLTPPLIRACAAMGFQRPSGVQSAVLEHFVGKETDCVVQSQNGTGKTAAYLLSVLAALRMDEEGRLATVPQALILVHTRELAMQVHAIAEKLAQFMTPKPVIKAFATDRCNENVQAAVIIGTSGVIKHALVEDFLTPRFLRLIIFDEADELFLRDSNSARPIGGRGGRGSPGRGGRGGRGGRRGGARGSHPAQDIVEFIDTFPARAGKIPVPRRMMLSATEPDQVRDRYREILRPALEAGRRPSRIFVKSSNVMPLQSVKQFYVNVDNLADKIAFVERAWHAASANDAVIFVDNKAMADQLASHVRESRRHVSFVAAFDTGRVCDLHLFLAFACTSPPPQLLSKGLKTRFLTGNLTPAERDEVLRGFREHEFRVIIATNIIARGIDVPTVSVVINFDIPRSFNENGQAIADPETYLHRVGRAGRFGRPGLAVTLISSRRDEELLRGITDQYGDEFLRESDRDANAIKAMFAEAASKQ